METAIKLKHPIKDANGNEVKELKFERLKVKHLKAMPAGAFEDGYKWKFNEMIPIYAALTNLPESVIEEIDFEDLPALTEGLQNFFEKSQVKPK